MKLTFEIFLGVFAALALADWLKCKEYEYQMRRRQMARDFDAMFDKGE